MRTRLDYDLRSENGCVLLLPPHVKTDEINMGEPDIFAADTQKYPVGSLAWYPGIGKKFRYVKAAEDITEATSARLVANGNYAAGVAAGGIAANVHGYNGLAFAQAEIGQSYIDIDLTERAVNFFEGSYLQLLPAANPIAQYYVIGSDVSTATYTRVYIDQPLKQTITVAMYIGISASPYTRIINGSTAPARYKSFVGIPFANPTSGQYSWIQTAGPVWIQPGSWADDRLPGRAPNFRDVYAAIDGAITCSWVFGAATDGYQRVGYLLDATAHNYGSVFIMLQLEG